MKTLFIIVLIITYYLFHLKFSLQNNYSGIACIARTKYVLVILLCNLKFKKYCYHVQRNKKCVTSCFKLSVSFFSPKTQDPTQLFRQRLYISEVKVIAEIMQFIFLITSMRKLKHVQQRLHQIHIVKLCRTVLNSYI